MPSTTPTSIGEASSCYFPNVRPQSVKSNSNIEIEPSYYSVAIQLDLGLDIELFCDNGEIPAEIFFQLVWALVLRCFAGKDDVAFDFIDALESHVSKTHTTIHEGNSVVEAAQALQADQVKDSSTNVNTLLCLSRDEAEVTVNPSSLGARLQEIHSNVRENPVTLDRSPRSTKYSTMSQWISTSPMMLYRSISNALRTSLLEIRSWESQVLWPEHFIEY